MSRPSAAVVGWAWRTPLGAEDAFARLLAGERAARLDPRLEGYEVRVVAPILGEPGRSKHARFLRRMGLFALETATQAMARAGVTGSPRLGLFSAVGGLRAHWNDMMVGLAEQRDDGAGAWERGLERIHPFWMLKHLSNNAHALLSADAGARGEGVTFGGANAGAQAIASAARALADGGVDRAVVVAYDTLLDPETLVELGARCAASRAPAPAAPYDEDATGFVPGEAAAALVLERVEDAGARAVALVSAHDTADAYPGEPTAPTLAAAVDRLADGVAVIDGAGRGRPDLDDEERAAAARVLGPRALLTSVTGAMGRLGAATALVQVIALAQAFADGRIYPIGGVRRATHGPLMPLAHAVPCQAPAALGISTGAPGLVGVVRVERP